MKLLLSSTATKDELSVYLSDNLIEYVKDTDKSYVVAYRNKIVATTDSFAHLASSQEEADTKLILHAVEASRQGATKMTFIRPTQTCSFYVLGMLITRRYRICHWHWPEEKED